MIEPSAFSLWLRRRRRILNLTQADLAQAIGCSTSAVRKLESGDLLPSAEMTEKMAERLGVAGDQSGEFALFARGDPNHFPSEDDPAAPVTPPAVAPAESQPPASQLRQPIFNLPAPFTSLVGREKEVAEIVARLRLPTTRLLTLTGAPGSGKTRLGIAVAERLAADFADGIHFAPLASISDPALVFSSLAHSLGLVEQIGGALQPTLSAGPTQTASTPDFPQLRELAAFLQTRHFLLLLDNFEHLLAAAVGLSTLLQAAPGLKIITTSREVLRLYGEFEISVPPLALPAPHNETPLAEIADNPAAQLFIERAQTVQPFFALTAQNAAQVARICVRLDGLPLALEMAAAQMKWQSLDAIAGQLADLRLNLQRTWRDANSRQQTLRAAIEWSYRLLPPAEQRLFVCLGSFAGGCTEEAAAAVWRAMGQSDPALSAVESTDDLLRALVERSLLQMVFSPTGAPRYTLLETIRAYALEQLEASGAAAAVRQAQAHWLLTFAQRADAQLYSGQAKLCLQRLETEHDNFRAILRGFAEGQGVESETALQLVAALSRFWNQMGHWAEGLRWLRLAVERGSDASLLTRARVLRHLTSALGNRGERAAALEAGTQSLALLRTVDNPPALADTLYILGFIYRGLAQYERSQACLEESLLLVQGLNDQQATQQNVLNALGNLMSALGNLPQATLYSTRLVELAWRTGDRNAIGNGLNSLGEIARLQGEYARAARHFEESISLAQESGSLSARAYRLPNLGFALLHLGQTERAESLFREGLALSHELGDRIVILQCLVGLALLAVNAGEWARAARLGGAVDQLLQSLELRFDQTDRAEYERLLAQLGSHQATAEIAAAWEQGRTATLDQVVGWVL